MNADQGAALAGAEVAAQRDIVVAQVMVEGATAPATVPLDVAVSHPGVAAAGHLTADERRCPMPMGMEAGIGAGAGAELI